MSRARVQRRRRDFRLLTGDGACWAVMTGSGDWQFILFALAVGLSEVTSGLVATVPLLAGAVLQLLTPWGVRMVGSIRRWVYLCAFAQALSLAALAAFALSGGISGWVLYVLVSAYWASGYMTGPPWITWVSSLVPDRIRARFWVQRSRWVQGGLVIGLLAGLVLQAGEQMGRPLIAFGVVFAVAALARIVSSILLSKQSDPEPGLIEKIEMPSRSTLRKHFSDRRTRGLLLYMLAFFLSIFVVAPFFGPYLREQLRFEYWQIMAITGTTFLAKVMVLPAVGRIAHRYGPGRVLWIGAIITAPAAALWGVSDSFWWLLSLQLYVGFGWACWETGSFLLVFDVIPAERRTPVMTVYQLAQAIVMVGGSLLGAALLEGVGVNRTGYLALFIATSLMRFVSLFFLASLEPSGLQLRHRARILRVRTMGFLPGGGSAEVLDPPGDDQPE